MVRNVKHEPAMSEPDVLMRAAEIGGQRTRAELASLDVFVRTHYPRLIRLAGLITRDTDQAQDAVQTALERAWRKRGTVRDPARLRPWLDRIVAREAIRQTHGSDVSVLRHDSSDWIQFSSAMPEPAEMADLREAVGRLSPTHRAVIGLHLYAGYSVEETAQVLAVPFDTVRSRLRAARKQLRGELEEQSR
jgi:RNA polymerase sigma-70 factor, ECF subfamily